MYREMFSGINQRSPRVQQLHPGASRASRNYIVPTSKNSFICEYKCVSSLPLKRNFWVCNWVTMESVSGMKEGKFSCTVQSPLPSLSDDINQVGTTPAGRNERKRCHSPAWSVCAGSRPATDNVGLILDGSGSRPLSLGQHDGTPNGERPPPNLTHQAKR